MMFSSSNEINLVPFLCLFVDHLFTEQISEVGFQGDDGEVN